MGGLLRKQGQFDEHHRIRDIPMKKSPEKNHQRSVSAWKKSNDEIEIEKRAKQWPMSEGAKILSAMATRISKHFFFPRRSVRRKGPIWIFKYLKASAEIQYTDLPRRSAEKIKRREIKCEKKSATRLTRRSTYTSLRKKLTSIKIHGKMWALCEFDKFSAHFVIRTL